MSDAFRDFFAREDRVKAITADLECRDREMRMELARLEKARDENRRTADLWERERIDTMYVAWMRDNAPDAPRRIGIVCPKCLTKGTVDGTDPTMSLLKCSCGCIFPLYPFPNDTRPHVRHDATNWTWTRTDSGYVCMPPYEVWNENMWITGTRPGIPFTTIRNGWIPRTDMRTHSNIISSYIAGIIYYHTIHTLKDCDTSIPS